MSKTPDELLDLVLGMMHAAVDADGKPAETRQERMQLVRWLSPIGEALAKGGALSQPPPRAGGPVHVASAADAGWPPPYAADKGFTQDLGIEGFALTRSGGAAFLHMRPLLKFGANAEQQVLEQAAYILSAAAGRCQARVVGFVRQERAAEAASDEGGGTGSDATDDDQCRKTDEHGMPCYLDDGHEGECKFPQIGATS